jgi:hypothetical protein
MTEASSDYKKLDETKAKQPELEPDGVFCSWEEEDELVTNDHYLSADVRERIASKPDLKDSEKLIIQRLAMKSFHLPGNSYWEDWKQFVCNNHIILAFFLSHPLHPFTRKERVLNLVASLAFGLTATSSIFLWYYYNGKDMHQPFFTLFGHTVEHGMFTTAIFGGICNVLWDFAIWFLQACPPCQPGGFFADKMTDPSKFFWFWLGSNIAFIVTAISICLAIHVIVLRASVIDDGNDQGYSHSISDYAFLIHFLIEVIMTQTIMFPIVAFTIFSGLLGCFRIPIIGGRPYQVWRLEKRMRRQRLERETPPEI